MADAVAATLGARGLADQIDVDGPADLVARLDPRRFDVIVANLAGNAIRHGRPPVRLGFGCASRDGWEGLELVVTDSGPGIPSDVLPVIFDRFVKAEAARSRSEGSGLGLSIARENAVLHGGALEAGNAAEGGGWGVRATAIISAGPAPEAGGPRGTITVFLVRKGKLVETTRPTVPGYGLLAIPQLGVPPTYYEESNGLYSEVPVARLWARFNESEGGFTLDVTPDQEAHWSRLALGQVACTGEALVANDRVNVRLTSAPETTEHPPRWRVLSCEDYRDLREEKPLNLSG
ncbi:ATP-binding protein [Actinomadura sp. 6N118]|uniref:ATP-binding protein n=1 Tax=Actinomadura sp. 6N118 TaxID=3375151 RepID=UPI0037B7556C